MLQVIHGSYGLKPAGPVMDFVLRNHAFFSGGIFWLNCTTPDFLNGGLDLVKAVSLNVCVWSRSVCVFPLKAFKDTTLYGLWPVT